MEQINNYTTLCLIDNFGCTRSVDDGTIYLCFIGNCIFETANLGEHLSHLDVHNEKWFGFCYSCSAQIHANKVPLLLELQHWNKCHRNEIGFSVVFQPDDKRNKLREAVDMARVKLLVSDDESELICLKPWNNPPETQKKCRKRQSRGCLLALYKCMDRNCAFSTSYDQGMLRHLEYHEKCAANTSIAEMSWLECAYCDLVSDTRSSLVQHIWEEHSSSAYQSPYCFYRSCTACNVVYHLKTFHEPRVSSVLVRSKYVFPLRCSEVCNEITYRMDYFINHLKTAHDNHFKCQFCGLNIPILEAIQHLSVHNIGIYQCVYCLCGANDIDSIQSHMCHAHPARLPYICVRLTRKNRILRDDELTSADSMFISKLSQKVHSKRLKMCPYTDEELLNNPLSLTTAEPISRPPLDFNENSRLIDDDLPFDGQDIVSFDDLKRDYSCDDWNEYFRKIRPIDGLSERKVDVDEGFGDDTGTNTTNSQMDRSEPDSVDDETDENSSDANLILDVAHLPVVHSEERKPVNRDSGSSILDDVAQSICSSRLNKTKVEPRSTIEPFTKFSDPKLPDVFRYRCAYCPKPFMNLQLVYDHWHKEHGKPNVTFMFQVIKIFKCCYCRYCNTYDDLKRHCEQKHPEKTFAIIDKMNQKKCALCTTVFCNASTDLIADHFEQHHNVAGINHTIRLESYLTDEWLDKIIAGKVFRRSGPVSSQIMYDCPQCPAARCNDQLKMVAHIRKHFLRFKCNCCEKTFQKIGMLKKHHAITHAKDKALSVVSGNENLSNYLEMKIIFPNGFVLTKRECVNTRFGAMDELVKMIQELNGSDLEIDQAKPAQRVPISEPKAMITRSKRTAEMARSSSLSKPKCGCDDGVDRKKSRLRPRSVETEKRKKWPTIPFGVTTRKRSNQSKTGK